MSRWRVSCSLLAVITFCVYLPVRDFQFVNYDDGGYVTQNPMVQGGLTWAGVKWAFTTTTMSNWHPLTWLSHMLDWQLFGSWAGGPHLVNAALHAANTALLFLLLLRLTRNDWRSAVIAALFAWHPLRVESVAWVSERKDVLSGFFALLALTAYARDRSKVQSPMSYVGREPKGEGRESARIAEVTERQPSTLDSRPSTDSGRWTLDFWLALGFYALGLMSKPMLVTLPMVFLLLDYWPLGRLSADHGRARDWARLVVEKWPFFGLSAASCVVTFLAQRSANAVAPLAGVPVGLRLANASVSSVEYLMKILWPVKLAVIYPMPKAIPGYAAFGVGAILALVTVWAWCNRRRGPQFLTGWLWYLGMLVPVIGLVQVGFQGMADRYTYLPSIGLLIVLVCGAEAAAARLALHRGLLSIAASAALVGCLVVTSLQISYWANSETLYTHALAVTGPNAIAENNLGLYLSQNGRIEEAIGHYRKAADLQPAFRYNLGSSLFKVGRFEEAAAELRKAVEAEPGYPPAHYGLATVLIRQGNVFDAVPELEITIRLQPGNTRALNDLAWIFCTAPDSALRNAAAAVDLAEKANGLSGGKSPGILGTLAAAYAESGRFQEAIATAELALRNAALQGNTNAVRSISLQLACFKTHAPYRDLTLGAAAQAH